MSSSRFQGEPVQDIKGKIFERHYNKYYPQVYGYIYKKVLNEQTAEDIAMSAFLSCWDKFDTFDESKASFQTWLYVIVNNKLKNYYRDRKETVEFEDSILDGIDYEDEILGALQIQDLRDHLYYALMQLDETQRKIVIYKYFKDMKSTQIADLLDLSPVNVRVKLKRALEKIQDYFNDNNIRWE